MTESPQSKKKELQQKLVAYLDNELSPEDKQAFEEELKSHGETARELEEMRLLMNELSDMHITVPREDFWDSYWEEIDDQIQRKVGWMIGLIGSVLLILYGVVKVYSFAENSVVQVGITLVCLGLAILVFTTVRGRLVEIPKDRYRKVKR